MQNVKRPIRRFLANGNYIEIDIQNAGPTIAWHIAEELRLDNDKLREYVLNRGVHLVFKGAKNFYLSLLNGGTCRVTSYSSVIAITSMIKCQIDKLTSLF